jgi:hypothetical protein
MEDNTDSDEKVTSEATKKDWIDFWYNSEDLELKKIYEDHEEGS